MADTLEHGNELLQTGGADHHAAQVADLVDRQLPNKVTSHRSGT
jgi:hypothetical protein